MIRLATNDDVPGILDLIGRVYAEYGDKVCTDPGGAEFDLLDIQANYQQPGGQFWVLDLAGQIKGTHATRPDESNRDVCGFRRLYLEQALRGTTDWGHQLMQITIDWASEKRFQRVEFWSDTRFERAHKFFTKFGFEHDGRVREMTDSFETYSEYFFSLTL